MLSIRRSRTHLLMCCSLLLILTACTPSDTATPTPREGENMATMRTIWENAQVHYKTLWIAAGSFRVSDYVDEQGESQRGPTALLFLRLGEDGSTAQHVDTPRVHAGQEVTCGTYVIKVHEVGQGELGPMVQVAISEVEADE